MASDPRAPTSVTKARPNVLSGPVVVPNVLRGTPAAPALPAPAGPWSGRRAGRPPGPLGLRRLGSASPFRLGSAAVAPSSAGVAHPSDFRANRALRVVWRVLFGLWTVVFAVSLATSAYGAPDQRAIMVAAVVVVWLLSLPLAAIVVALLAPILDPLARIPALLLPAQFGSFVVALVAGVVAQFLLVAAFGPPA